MHLPILTKPPIPDPQPSTSLETVRARQKAFPGLKARSYFGVRFPRLLGPARVERGHIAQLQPRRAFHSTDNSVNILSVLIQFL